NHLIGSHPGYRYPVQTQENWTLAGALWDPHGYWGAAGNYWTYDTPFLTSGANCTAVAPAGSNGMSCATEYYGVGDFYTDNSQRYSPYMPIRATRYDAGGNVIGTWSVGDGTLAPKLGNMRHFSAMKGGRYLLEFPGYATPANFLQIGITNAYRADDEFVLGVPFSGAANPKVVLRNSKASRTLTAAASLADVQAGAGDKFWHDKGANTVWVKAKTPNGDAYANQSANSDANLYRYFELRIDK
ncbi:MAG: hypothetical protein ACRCV9_03310, partial [Burkholderiaceae bacterium]